MRFAGGLIDNLVDVLVGTQQQVPAVQVEPRAVELLVGAFQLKSIRGSRSFSDSGRDNNDDDVKQRLVPIVFTRA